MKICAGTEINIQVSVLYALLYMYMPRKKPRNVSIGFLDFRVSTPKSPKYPGNVGISRKFPVNVKLRTGPVSGYAS